MRDEQKFFQLLKPLRRRLLWETILNMGKYSSYLFRNLVYLEDARPVVFYCSSRKLVARTLFLVFVYCAICFFRDKPSWYQTVLIMNEFIPDDLVLTAYSVLTKEGELERLIARAANRTILRYLEQALKKEKALRFISAT